MQRAPSIFNITLLCAGQRLLCINFCVMQMCECLPQGEHRLCSHMATVQHCGVKKKKKKKRKKLEKLSSDSTQKGFPCSYSVNLEQALEKMCGVSSQNCISLLFICTCNLRTDICKYVESGHDGGRLNAA